LKSTLSRTQWKLRHPKVIHTRSALVRRKVLSHLPAQIKFQYPILINQILLLMLNLNPPRNLKQSANGYVKMKDPVMVLITARNLLNLEALPNLRSLKKLSQSMRIQLMKKKKARVLRLAMASRMVSNRLLTQNQNRSPVLSRHPIPIPLMMKLIPNQHLIPSPSLIPTPNQS
jgi:hypothetical protein